MSKSDSSLGNISLRKTLNYLNDPFDNMPLNEMPMIKCISDSNIMELNKITVKNNKFGEEILRKMTCPFILWSKKCDDKNYICEYVNGKYKNVKIKMTLSDYINTNNISYYEKYIDVINNRKNQSVKIDNKVIEIIYVNNNWFYEIHFHDSGNMYLSVINKKIKDPLNHIVKTLDQIDNNNVFSKKENKNVKTMKKACYELVRVANDIVDMINLFNETNQIKNDKVALEKLLKKVNGMYEPNNNIIFSIKYADTLPKYLYICGKSLTKVIMKILDNSFEYTKKGSVELDVSFFTKDMYLKSKCPHQYNDLKTSKKNRHNLLFKIKDTGDGINLSKKKILDNFLGIENDPDFEMKDQYENFGFGLTICKHIISYYKGNIWYTSYNDLGCIFYFNIICKCYK